MYVSHPNSVWPKIGSRTCLPNRITRPEIARIENEIAMVQCTMRSSGVKRSIMRPVRGVLSGIVPRQAKNARIASGTINTSQPPHTVITPLRNRRHF